MQRFLQLIMLIACYRLLPHPANLSPIVSISLFSGILIASNQMRYVLPIAAMLVADVVIGFYASLPFTYLAVGLCVYFGSLYKGRLNFKYTAFMSCIGALTFDLVSNFGTWIVSRMYPHTFAGLIECYAAAVPFMQRTLCATLFYSYLLLCMVKIRDYLRHRIVTTGASNMLHNRVF